MVEHYFQISLNLLQVTDKKIVQRWRSKQWPREHYSTVTFEIDQKQDHTELVITQTAVPKRY